MQLIIGTYTETLDFVHGTAEGILTAPFDPVTGAVGPPAVAARVATRPTWRCRPTGPTCTR